MEPTLVTPPVPQRPIGHWLHRTCRALLVEHRLPTRAAAGLDRALRALGWRTKTIRIGACRVRVRRLEEDEHYVREVLIDQAYNPPGYAIREHDTVLDVGGNIGAFALHAGLCAHRGRVITIEPVAANFRLLTRNLIRNRLPNVTAIRAAVVGTPVSQVTVYLSRLGSGHHSIVSPTDSAAGSQQVPAVRLEEIWERCAMETCDFLKMDCEGAEFEIFASLPLAIARRIGRLAIEYHTPRGAAKRPAAEGLLSRIGELGFQVDRYTDIVGTERGMIFARRATAEFQST